jgi:hypothetical protein
VWETWSQAAMGLKFLPFQACQAMGFAEEVIWENRRDTRNIFWWDQVQMNFPGSEQYDPTKPWVSKIWDDDKHIAADVVTFVDDACPSGPTKREAWLAARQTASTLGHLGIQDALRKQRDSSQTTGA